MIAMVYFFFSSYLSLNSCDEVSLVFIQLYCLVSYCDGDSFVLFDWFIAFLPPLASVFTLPGLHDAGSDCSEASAARRVRGVRGHHHTRIV
jgi:hypothetical protein